MSWSAGRPQAVKECDHPTGLLPHACGLPIVLEELIGWPVCTDARGHPTRASSHAPSRLASAGKLEVARIGWRAWSLTLGSPAGAAPGRRWLTAVAFPQSQRDDRDQEERDQNPRRVITGDVNEPGLVRGGRF